MQNTVQLNNDAIVSTFKDFVLRVTALNDIADAYDIFENECTNELRDQIYALSSNDYNEPFRTSMHILGFTTY
jgi:hypothetical protein